MRCRSVAFASSGLLLLVMGCETLRPRAHDQPGNPIDLHYKLQSTPGLAPITHEGDLSLVRGYRQLSTILYSECRNFPSDSSYLTILFAQKNCSSILFLPQAVSRLLREGDVASLPGYQPIYYQGRLEWIDFPELCP